MCGNSSVKVKKEVYFVEKCKQEDVKQTLSCRAMQGIHDFSSTLNLPPNRHLTKYTLAYSS